ncbi:type 1 glutamine amidotransferase domain-containing protein [Metabacillus niabensis]|uniref:type 1 glutamine amidotransferase domain-containing protein n=1 Tax=Metabacillus niabensis TaxID=324854 RepID=UPI001CF9CC75|nr:type 1 glutamine amidotransferase domain-containing protein [Metabacillus niabensis]
MRKVAVLVGDMYHHEELQVPANAIEEAGYEITLIGKEANIKLQGVYGGTVETQLGIGEVDPLDFDALFIPGGFSPDILRADDRFVSFVKKFDFTNKPIFAICHGPQLLINADILQGKQMTGYKSIHMDLRNAGAIVYDEPVVVWNHSLVTSRTPDDLKHFTVAIISVLNKKNKLQYS